MSSSVSSNSLKQMHAIAENLNIGMDESAVPDLSKRTDAIASGRIPYRELQHLYEELSDKLKKVSNEKDELALLASQRQEAFLRTEARYQEDLRLLETRLQKMGLEDKSRMEPLRQLHGNIQDTINSIQNKTARVLQDQERDLIRAFRARLADVTVELENERKKNESGSAEWVARCRKLTEELEWLRDLTDKLTSENKAVLKDNRRFKRQMKTQEEDREFLIKQLVSVKKENARLRYSFDQLMAGNVQPTGLAPTDESPIGLLPPGTGTSTGTVSSITGLPMSQTKPTLRAGTPVTDQYGNRSTSSTPFGGRSLPPSRPQSAMVQPSANLNHRSGGLQSRPGTAVPQSATDSEWAEKEQRYKSMIHKLQRQVEDGVRSYRALRTQYTNELASRTELQTFVKKCIDDVRIDMAERGRSATLRRAASQHRVTSASAVRSKQSLPPSPLDPRSIPLSEFTPQDRISVMEWLMSQDAVIFMLYEKIFPTATRPVQPNDNHSHHNNNGSNSNSDLLKNLGGLGGGSTNHPGVGQPGSLFYDPPPPSSFARPSSSPSLHQTASSTLQARPQTAVGGANKHQQRSIPNTLNKPVQYERPLGQRPLSGFAVSESDSQTSSNSSHRPFTAVSSSSSTRTNLNSISNRPSTAAEIVNAANIEAEVEAELRAARAERQRPEIEDGDEEDEDPDSHLAAATHHQHRHQNRLGQLSENEEDGEERDRRLYEEKGEDEEE